MVWHGQSKFAGCSDGDSLYISSASSCRGAKEQWLLILGRWASVAQIAVGELPLTNHLATIARSYCFTVVVVILVAARNSSERRRVQRSVSGRPGNPAHIKSNENPFLISTVCPPSCAGSNS